MILQTRKTTALTVLLAALLAAACNDRETAGSPREEAAPGEVIRSTADFDIDAYQGKVVVLNFWATWCGPCRVEIPALIKLRESFSEDEVAIIGVSTGEFVSGEQLQKRLEDFIGGIGINYPIYSDEDRATYGRYNAKYAFGQSIPATLVIDKQGEVMAVHRGIPPGGSAPIYKMLGDEIQKILER
jgi:thiol-disulfide isomerase/thioredoxin